MPSKTFLVGDEIATGLDKALRKLPNTLPLWTIALSGWPIMPLAAEDVVKKIRAIDDDWKKRGGSDLPTTIIVSAGRVETLSEPDNASADDLAELASDVKSVARAFKGTGAEVFWVLPPAITGERKARGVIASALRQDGVRLLDAAPLAADTKASIDKPAPPDIPDSTYDVIAKNLKAIVPVGPSPFSNILLMPTAETAKPIDKAKTFLRSAIDSISTWSTPAKVASGAAAVAVVATGAYAASQPKKKP